MPYKDAFISPMTDQELKQTIVHIIRKYLGNAPAVNIFLFGSRAARQHIPRSDYDIGIETGTPIPFAMMGRIQADLDELPVLQRIEVVDFCRVSDAFKKEALVSVEEW
jgi:predicted nucleotidyltransferase